MRISITLFSFVLILVFCVLITSCDTLSFILFVFVVHCGARAAQIFASYLTLLYYFMLVYCYYAIYKKMMMMMIVIGAAVKMRRGIGNNATKRGVHTVYCMGFQKIFVLWFNNFPVLYDTKCHKHKNTPARQSKQQTHLMVLFCLNLVVVLVFRYLKLEINDAVLEKI